MFCKIFILIFFLLRVTTISFAQIPPNYYSSASGLTGQNLKTALHNIIKGHTEIPYTSSSTDTWDVLKKTDKDTVNPDNVILIYTGRSVNAAQENNNGNGWEREHVWAKSHGDFDTDKSPGRDLHNLKPINGAVNNSRGNKDFDNGGKRYITTNGDTSNCYTDNDSWEPRDIDKGDVARILFYMSVRYEGDDGNPDLELVDAVNTDALTVVGKGYHGKLSTLLKWNKVDPVDSFEIRRNNIIYSYQKNRNPFIDHPEFADLIWTTTGVYLAEIQNVKVYPNPATSSVFIDWPIDEPAHGTLYSITGDCIMKFEFSHTTELPVTHLKAGIYLLKISSREKEFMDKILVK